MLVNPKKVEPTVQRAIHFNHGVYDKLLKIKEATGKSVTVQVNEILEQVLEVGGNADGSDAATKKSMGRSRRTRISTKA